MFEALVVLGFIALVGLIFGIRDAIKEPPKPILSPHGEQPGDKLQTSFTLDDIQGDWRMTSVGRNGNFAPSTVIEETNLLMSIEGPRYSVENSTGRLILTPAADGVQMDQIEDDGDTHHCIARLRNDELEICQADVGQQRPTDFRPDRTDDASLTRFARVRT